MAKKESEEELATQRREAWVWAIKAYKEDPKRLGDLAELVGAMVKEAEQEKQKRVLSANSEPKS